ncbi:MAG: hypothetical protein AAF533_07155 [Acidobacteriota bacterium]
MSVRPTEEVLSTARVALSAELGREVVLDEPVGLVSWDDRAAEVLRCRLEGSPSGESTTVIVKASNLGHGHVRREIAALRFLNEIPEADGLVPRLLAAAPDDDLMVISDLGPDDRWFARWVEGGARDEAAPIAPDVASAVAAFHAHQRAMARLHGVTQGRLIRYEALLAEVAPTESTRHRCWRLDEALRALPDEVAPLLSSVPSELGRELTVIARVLDEPGPFLVLTHGDPTLANGQLDGRGEIVLFDLEAVAPRHALVDGSFAAFRYLHSMWARRLPSRLRKELQATYRAELARWIPEAADDALFEEALAASCAAWLAGLLCLLPRALKQDEEWNGPSLRQRVWAGLEHAAEMPGLSSRWPALAEVVENLLDRLGREWGPLAPLPGYRALR